MIIDRVIQIIEYKGINKSQFYRETGLSNGFLDKVKDIGSSKIEDILNSYPEINPAWLLTGKGEMLLADMGNNEPGNTMIPLYNDVSSIGGISNIADISGVSQPTEWINAGDWFRDATAAIRHYGDSMIEYPSGSILALKEVQDRNLIVWGRNYSIETTEFRITKRLQRGKSEDYISAYSSNNETYPDGTLIHQPIDIHSKSIKRLYLVLGYVTKEYSSGVVGMMQ